MLESSCITNSCCSAVVVHFASLALKSSRDFPPRSSNSPNAPVALPVASVSCKPSANPSSLRVSFHLILAPSSCFVILSRLSPFIPAESKLLTVSPAASTSPDMLAIASIFSFALPTLSPIVFAVCSTLARLVLYSFVASLAPKNEPIIEPTALVTAPIALATRLALNNDLNAPPSPFELCSASLLAFAFFSTAFVSFAIAFSAFPLALVFSSFALFKSSSFFV